MEDPVGRVMPHAPMWFQMWFGFVGGLDGCIVPKTDSFGDIVGGAGGGAKGGGGGGGGGGGANGGGVGGGRVHPGDDL